jgi:L,D-transpeptidase YcbB
MSDVVARAGKMFLGRFMLSSALVVGLTTSAVAEPWIAPFSQSVAIAAVEDEAIAAIYSARDYAPIWTGAADAARRQALLTVLAGAVDHGLPGASYDPALLAAAFRSATTEGDRGRLDVQMTQALLRYMHDMTMGAISPRAIDATIVIERDAFDPAAMFAAFLAAPSPERFLRDLVPQAPEYAQLMKERIRLQRLIATGGWGATVVAEKLAPGETGPAVVALRDRLVAIGYLRRSVTAIYDDNIMRAVQRFQVDHGLTADGVAGVGTIAALNVGPEVRLQSVLVALERLRWIGDTPRGSRHIWVNLPDFTAKIIDHGRVTFSTRAVIGKNEDDRHTPEFSDMMEYMVVNPSWSVPRSIIVNEYLPLLQRNRNAVGHLSVVDRNGRIVPRGAVNFAGYSASTFPFGLRQAPSDGNALGKVKFIFPNPYNIYLHDTPAKDLFSQEVRAYSHGCVRLGSPFDFAYALLAAQTDDPQGVFDRALQGGNETSVRLDAPVPVHLVYFTAWPGAKGQMGYRQDVYGRDRDIWTALAAAGVAMIDVQG